MLFYASLVLRLQLSHLMTLFKSHFSPLTKARLLESFKVDMTLMLMLLFYQDIAGTLATEVAEDSAQVAKLRSALESVDHKRRKVFI